MAFRVPEKHRVTTGRFATRTATHGNNGMFFIPTRPGGSVLRVIVSDSTIQPVDLARWEHVSVSLGDRCPTWEEMCKVKALFWDDEDPVMQLHPPRSQWVNNHAYCLHLWRPLDAEIPLPPQIMVGIPSLGTIAGGVPT